MWSRYLAGEAIMERLYPRRDLQLNSWLWEDVRQGVHRPINNMLWVRKVQVNNGLDWEVVCTDLS